MISTETAGNKIADSEPDNHRKIAVRAKQKTARRRSLVLSI
jgi:hypothetical protein